MFLLCFEVIRNECDSLSLAVCTCCISTCILRFAGLLPVRTVFMMLIFAQLAPVNTWRGGSCQLEDVPPGKDC